MAAPTLGTNTTKAIAATAEYVQELWTREVEKPFLKSLQAAKLVQNRSGLASGGGDLVHVPFFSSVDARAKSASTAVTYDSPDGTAVTINIDKHYYSAVLIEDIAKVQSNYDLASGYREAQAEAVARQIDTDILGQYGSVGTTVSGGASVDDADILAVVAALDAANTPQSERYGIVGAGAKADLLNINKYVAYDQTGKTGKAVDGSNGMIGNIYGMALYMSTNAPVSGTGRELFFHKKALTLIEQMKPEYKMEYSVDYVGTKAVLHAIYGVGVERPASFVAITRTIAA